MKKLDIGLFHRHLLRHLRAEKDLTINQIKKKKEDHHLSHRIDKHLTQITTLQVLVKNEINLIIIL